MSAVRAWLLRIICTALVLSLTETLFPKGKFRTVGNFIGGLILLLVTVRPLLRADILALTDYRQEIEWRTEDYAAAQQDQWETIISEKTAAYIQDKASSLGRICRAEVRCEEREGVPFPAEVWLDIPYDGALSTMIETDLAIGQDHQHWKETA